MTKDLPVTTVTVTRTVTAGSFEGSLRSFRLQRQTEGAVLRLRLL